MQGGSIVVCDREFIAMIVREGGRERERRRVRVCVRERARENEREM